MARISFSICTSAEHRERQYVFIMFDPGMFRVKKSKVAAVDQNTISFAMSKLDSTLVEVVLKEPVSLLD